jgi:hypothetical protein
MAYEMAQGFTNNKTMYKKAICTKKKLGDWDVVVDEESLAAASAQRKVYIGDTGSWVTVNCELRERNKWIEVD